MDTIRTSSLSRDDEAVEAPGGTRRKKVNFNLYIFQVTIALRPSSRTLLRAHQTHKSHAIRVR